SLFAQQGADATVAPVVDEAKGGLVRHREPYNRIREVQVLPNESVVYLTGFISQRLKGDNYLFRERDQNDRAGNLIEGDRMGIEVADDLWQGQVVKVGDQVKIVGEVNRNDGIATIQVGKLTKDLEYERHRDALNARYRSQQSDPSPES